MKSLYTESERKNSAEPLNHEADSRSTFQNNSKGMIGKPLQWIASFISNADSIREVGPGKTPLTQEEWDYRNKDHRPTIY